MLLQTIHTNEQQQLNCLLDPTSQMVYESDDYIQREFQCFTILASQVSYSFYSLFLVQTKVSNGAQVIC